MLRSADIDFNKVISGKPISKDKNFIVYSLKNEKRLCRLGVSIPKTKINKATKRNKLKRAIRHQLAGLEKAPIDIVIVLSLIHI